jgi:surfeit locus 1 family protein
VNGGREARRQRTGLVVPTILALIAFGGLIGLGNWQLDRKAWKEDLVATLNQRLAAEPADLPPRPRWHDLDPAKDEFRRVRFAAELAPNDEALIYTSGSSLRPDISGPGYWVFAPARLADGSVVVVNRGFVPEGRQDPETRSAGTISGRIDLVGVMRWPESPGWFTPRADPTRNLWFVRDQLAVADSKRWGEVAPFFVELESPPPPGGLPRPGPLKVNLPNDHLQYAITWYGLALVLALGFPFWLRSRWRDDKAHQSGDE